MPDNLIERVLKTVRNYEMLKAGDSVLAAVSGGPDSVFMLHALVRLRKKFALKEITVSCLDHGLRGDESKGDSAFVKDMSEELGVRLFQKRVNLRERRSKDLSTEEEARIERYRFFREAAVKSGASVIATGHTLDDQAETVLMRIVKGTSLKGMAGIAPVREEGAWRVIRPLIQLEKSEILRYLDGKGIRYRIDRTNLEPVYFRNVVRGEIIPFLEKYNPRLKRVLFNLSEHLREDFEFIAGEKRKFQNSIAAGRERAVDVSLKDLVVQPKAIQKEVLRDMLERSGGEVKKLSFRHWKEMEYLIKRKGRGSAVDLPGGIRVTRTERSITFSRI